MNSPIEIVESVPAEFRREKVRIGKVPISTKLFQGMGALPGSHKDLAFGTFLLLYYSQILGIPATSASIVLAIALVVDAFADPLVGAYSDNFRSRFGRRHLFMYCAAIPLGLFIYLLFSPPSGASTALLTGWLLTFTLLVRFAFTFFVIPWNALAAEYSQDYVERTSIITYRALVGATGGLVFFFLVFTFVFPGSDQYEKGQLDPRNYPLFAIILGLLIPTWCLLTTQLTRREIPYLLQPVNPTPRLQFTVLLRQILLAFRSPNFRRVFVAFMLFSGIAGVNGVVDIYMNTYFWEFGTGELRWFGFVLIGALFAFAVIPPLQRRFEKQSILVVALATSLVLGMLKVTLRFADVWPENGDPNLLVALIIHASVIVALLTVGGVMFSSMMADLVDEQEIRTKIRQEGVFTSALGFASKSVSSIGLIVGGLLLDLVIRFPRQSLPGEVDADTLFRLAFIDGIAVPALFVIPIYLLSRYSLTRLQLEDIQSELGQRG